jgi:hypothetical protein
VNKETVTAAVSAAKGKMRVLKVPGEAGISRASLVSLIRDNRESLKELHAHCSTDGERGYWTPKQVHAAMSAAGSRFRRLAVDVKSRGVCLALIQQLACPVVRVRRLDVRAAQLGAVEKVELFGAIARMRSKAAALVRSGSALSLTDIANEYGASGGFRGLGGGEEDEEDTLRCLTLASCGLDRDDAAALADAVAAGIGGDSTDPGVPATIRGLGFGHAAADEHRAPPLNLNLGDNPSLGCVGARAISALVAEGSVATLSLENCGVGELGAAALGEALASPGCVLRSLNIGRNFVGAAGAAAIAAGLARGAKARAAAGLAATLTDLRIGNNAIGCEGMVALASTAARSDAFVALERLEVPMNGIGPDGAAALARSILATPSVPDVGEEDDEEPFTASDVCGAPVLRELFMDGNPLGAVGAAAIANACAAGSADDPRPSLEVLSLSATRLGVSGASALAAAMIIPNGRLSCIAHLDISCQRYRRVRRGVPSFAADGGWGRRRRQTGQPPRPRWRRGHPSRRRYRGDIPAPDLARLQPRIGAVPASPRPRIQQPRRRGRGGRLRPRFPSGWAPVESSWTCRETPSGTREPRRWRGHSGNASRARCAVWTSGRTPSATPGWRRSALTSRRARRG